MNQLDAESYPAAITADKMDRHEDVACRLAAERREVRFRVAMPSGRARKPGVLPVSGHTLLRDIATIGWSERDLGRRSGRSHSNVNRCSKGLASLTIEEAEWIAMAADFLLTHPYPRVKPLDLVGMSVLSPLGSACPGKGRAPALVPAGVDDPVQA